MFSSTMSDFGDVVEILDQRAQAVAVRGDETRLPDAIVGAIVSCQYGRNRATVSFSDSVSGSSLGVRARVARVVRRVALVVDGQRRRRNVVAAAPDLGLRLAVLRGGLRLVQPLQRAVVPLVQPPALGHRNPEQVERVERDPERLDRALQHRRVRDVEDVAAVAQQAAGLARFVAAARRSDRRRPAGEAVFLVPGALAVAEQDDLCMVAQAACRIR